MANSCGHVASYFYARPPLAIFLISLLVLAVTTLSLGFYCHYNTSLTNVDILDWNRLITGMSKLKYCLHTNLTEFVDSNRSVFSASLEKIPFDSDLKMADSSTCVGNISLSLLGLGYISQDNITVRIQSGSGAACVQVESEHSIFIENLKNESIGQSGTCQSSSGHAASAHVWTAHTAAHLPHTWCSRPGQTIFEMELGPMEGMETFLSQEERNVMYEHLVVTSLVLVLACVIMVTWAWVSVARDRTRDMTLLPRDSESDQDDF